MKTLQINIFHPTHPFISAAGKSLTQQIIPILKMNGKSKNRKQKSAPRFCSPKAPSERKGKKQRSFENEKEVKCRDQK